MEQNEKDRLQYMIDVMQAYKEGKEIESSSLFSKVKTWSLNDSPRFDWANFDYRIKPEPPKHKYRPFESAEEVMEAIKEHGHFLRKKSTGAYVSIREFDFMYIWISYNEVGNYFASVFENYTFADGTPFGKLIEE